LENSQKYKMLKIPSYPICKTYENAYTFMNLEKTKIGKTQKSKFQNPKIPKSKITL
jgi:hypothetical protein